jgi:hypothetical protein
MVDAVPVVGKSVSVAGGALSHGRFIYSWDFKGYDDTSMLTTTSSKFVGVVAIAYLVVFFALASGMVNAIIEGGSRGEAFILPSRSVQTSGETVVITLLLFIGMAGTFLLYESGRSLDPRAQKAMLISGFGAMGVALLIGFMLVSVKL